MRYFLTISGILLSWIFPALIDHVQGYIFLGVVGTIGMAHGSLDHLVHQADDQVKSGMFRFYALYLLATLAVALVWWFDPLVGLALFSASSAYHFGQSEIRDQKFSSPVYLWIRRFSWGSALLSIPLIIHGQSLQLSLQEWQIDTTIQTLRFYGLATLSLAIGFYFLATWMGSQTTGSPAASYQLFPVLSWLCYAVLLSVTPPLWGFTLYFGIWHAWPALEQVSKTLKLNQAKDWVRALLPNYLPSLLATLAWIWLASWWAPEYVVAGLLVLLSALTVPHTMVFERLYRSA